MTHIDWTKVGDRLPDNSGEAWEGSPCTPYVPCLVFACKLGYPQGGVKEYIRWDVKNNEWFKSDIAMLWTLQHPYTITHFCDKINSPDF